MSNLLIVYFLSQHSCRNVKSLRLLIKLGFILLLFFSLWGEGAAVQAWLRPSARSGWQDNRICGVIGHIRAPNINCSKRLTDGAHCFCLSLVVIRWGNQHLLCLSFFSYCLSQKEGSRNGAPKQKVCITFAKSAWHFLLYFKASHVFNIFRNHLTLTLWAFWCLSVFYFLALYLTQCISDSDAHNPSVVEINNNNYNDLSPSNYSFESKICMHFKEFLIIQILHFFSAKSRITNAMIQGAERRLRKLIKCVDCFMKKLQAYESLTLCN